MNYKLNLGLILFAVLFFSCQQKHESQGFETMQSLPTLKAEQMDFSSFKSYPASIEGTQNIAIRAKLNGYISKVFVDEGEFVRKGDLLFKLETRSLSQNAKAAEAAIHAAQLEVDKLTPLVKAKIVSNIQLQTAQAQLERARGDYQSIQENINYTNITSPVDGVVGTINFREGSLVSPSTQEALTSVSNIERVFTFFSLNEKEFLKLLKKVEGNNLNEKISNFPEVRLELADGSTYLHKGKIETIAGQVDKQTGAIRFRAVFNNPEKILRNGNSGRVKLPIYYKDVVAIPTESTFELQGQRHVYLVEKDNVLKSKMIKVRESIDKYILVDKGLVKGEQILAKGVHKAFPGMKIKPMLTSTTEVVNSFQTVFK